MALVLPQRIFFISGKGGTGKSTVAAALALSFARSGQKTLVCEVNADERITQLLGHSPAGPEIKKIEENLWTVDIRPQDAMREYALMILKFKTVYRAVFENRLVRNFLKLIPSLQELVMIGKIFYHLRETQTDGKPRFDRIVVDAPATGHAIAFLTVPQVILDTVPPGPMTAEAQIMRDLLVDPAQSAAVLVSLPEEMPLNETVELAQELKNRVKLHHALTVLNQSFSPRFNPSDLANLVSEPQLKQIAAAHMQRVNASAQALTRLSELKAPVVCVPRFFDHPFGRKTVEKISELLVVENRGGAQ